MSTDQDELPTSVEDKKTNNTKWFVGIAAALVVGLGVGIFAGIQIENSRIRSALTTAFAGFGSGSNSSPTTEAEPPPESQAPASPPVALGVSQITPSTEVKATVYAIDTKVPAASFDSDKSPRTAIDIEVCAQAPIEGLSGQPWSLTSGSSRFAPSSYASDPKLPEYASASSSTLTQVAVGECLRGWLMMDVPSGAKLEGVRYGLPDGTLLRWTL